MAGFDFCIEQHCFCKATYFSIAITAFHYVVAVFGAHGHFLYWRLQLAEMAAMWLLVCLIKGWRLFVFAGR